MENLIKSLIIVLVLSNCSRTIYKPDLPSDWEKVGNRNFLEFYSSNTFFPKESFYVCKIGEIYSSIGNTKQLYPKVCLDSLFINKLIIFNLNEQLNSNSYLLKINFQNLFKNYSQVEGSTKNDYINYFQFKDGTTTYIGTGNPRIKPTKIYKLENDTILYYNEIDEKNQAKHKYLTGYYHFPIESNKFVTDYNSDNSDFGNESNYNFSTRFLDSFNNYIKIDTNFFPLLLDSMQIEIYLGDPKSYKGSLRFSSLPPFYSVGTEAEYTSFMYKGNYFKLFYNYDQIQVCVLEYFVISTIDKYKIYESTLAGVPKEIVEESLSLKNVFGNDLLFFKIDNLEPTILSER